MSYDWKDKVARERVLARVVRRDRRPLHRRRPPLRPRRAAVRQDHPVRRDRRQEGAGDRLRHGPAHRADGARRRPGDRARHLAEVGRRHQGAAGAEGACRRRARGRRRDARRPERVRPHLVVGRDPPLVADRPGAAQPLQCAEARRRAALHGLQPRRRRGLRGDDEPVHVRFLARQIAGRAALGPHRRFPGPLLHQGLPDQSLPHLLRRRGAADIRAGIGRHPASAAACAGWCGRCSPIAYIEKAVRRRGTFLFATATKQS